jgi:hypothetical protein
MRLSLNFRDHLIRISSGQVNAQKRENDQETGPADKAIQISSAEQHIIRHTQKNDISVIGLFGNY